MARVDKVVRTAQKNWRTRAEQIRIEVFKNMRARVIQ